MSLKEELILILHAIITTVIVLSLPMLSVVVTYCWLQLPNWACLITGLLSSIPTILLGIRYMFFIVNKNLF